MIGNGVAGITAACAVRSRHADVRIHVVSNESDLFFSRTALMYIYMGQLRFEDTLPHPREFYARENLELVRDTVTAIDTDARRLRMSSGRELEYDVLLIATGAKVQKFNWPGIDLDGVQGLYSLQDLELLEKNTRSRIARAVLVGGGLIGVELAEMLRSRDIPVTFLVREAGYWDNVLPPEEAAIIGAEVRAHAVDLRLESGLERIEGSAGRVTGVVTTGGERIACSLVGISTGVTPNIDVVRAHPSIKSGRGILVDRHFRTSVPGVFAVGDCAQFTNADGSPGPVEQLWYTGRLQGASAGGVIAAELGAAGPAPPYDRGIAFNSAKFFSIEYQVYGDVPNRPAPDRNFFWRHPKNRSAFRLVWEHIGENRVVKGMHSLGFRMRQNVCENWIRSSADVDDVMSHLGDAAFDPEFFRSISTLIQKTWKTTA